MDIAEINKRIAHIKKNSYDDELAHIEEDKLFIDFIKLVANSDNHSLSEMAKEVLKVQAVEFSRWCA